VRLRSFFAGPPSAPREAVVDGVPCRPYRIGEHAATLSRMLLTRLIISAAVAALLTVMIPLALALVGGGNPSATAIAIAHWTGSPIAFAVVLLGVDYLLIRGRLSRAISMLTWAGRMDAEQLRATTGIRRPTDRLAAAAWLGEHPDASTDDPAMAASRVHLQVLIGDLAGARSTVAGLPRGTTQQLALADLLGAQVDVAAGQPFDAGQLRTNVKAITEPDQRAMSAVEAAALIAQARWTCDGDHLAPLQWAAMFVERRDRNTLLKGYWIPITVMALITSLVLAFVFPASA
jgi:hypothetical protein